MVQYDEGCWSSGSVIVFCQLKHWFPFIGALVSYEGDCSGIQLSQ